MGISGFFIVANLSKFAKVGYLITKGSAIIIINHQQSSSIIIIIAIFFVMFHILCICFCICTSFDVSRYQPEWKAVYSQHAVSKANSFADEEKTQCLMASTPCSSTGVKLRKQKFKTNEKCSLQKQIFREEIKSKIQQSLSVEESTESDAVEAVHGVLQTFSIKTESISPVVGSTIDDVAVLSLDMSNCLEIDGKVTGPRNDGSPYSIAAQGRHLSSMNTPNHAEMTFLVSFFINYAII